MNTSIRTLAVSALVLTTAACCRMPCKPNVSAAPAPKAVPMIELPARSNWIATASALQEDFYAASNAIDGRMDTRWSTPPTDPQWLQIDLGRVATVCGLTLFWEAAFASEYNIEVSENGTNWTQVYEQKNGDGNSDDINFAPILARYIKINGTKRGTGWGYSIWDVDVKGPSEQVVVNALSQPGHEASKLVDGSLDTSWIAAQPGPTLVTLDLRKQKGLGGVRIDWGDNYARELNLYVSQDGSAWSKMAELKEGTGIFDVVLHPKVMARYLRLDLTVPNEGNKPMEVKEISLRGADETVTPLALYQIAAQKARPGVYPDSLRKRQVYWTLVGLPSDRQESLLDEYGNLEPVANGSSLMPYVFSDGRLLSAFDASVVTQQLDSGYLPMPSVQWGLGELKLKIDAFAWGATDKSVTFIRYELSNTGTSNRGGRLFLAIRPVQVNPPWQYGGLSNIKSLELARGPDGAAVKVNGNEQYIPLVTPDGFGARPFNQGDIARELVKGELPPDQKVENSGDLISGAMLYNFYLKPGESKVVVVAAPLHGTSEIVPSFVKRGQGDAYPSAGAAFEDHRNEMRRFWKDQIDKVVFELPAADVANTVKSQLGYILINRDGAAIQPGSRNYKRSWMRDGCLTSAALLRMGLNDQVREYLEWYSQRIGADGWVPPILNNDGTVNKGFGWDNEYDSQGEFVFAIMEYYRFTRDHAFLEQHYPQIQHALQYLQKLRERTLAPDYMKNEPARERFVGILPPSISHEGYSPAVHSYWDDFFALKGWKDGREAALALGDTNTAAWAQEQYQLLRDGVRTTIAKTMEYKKIDYVPGCAEKGDCDPTSTTIALFPCDEQDLLPAAALKGMFDRYFTEVEARTKPDWRGGYTPYEARNISTFVRLGEKDKANFLLNFLLACRRPPAWNHLAEVVLGDPRMGSYIGDMPHTWVGSSLVDAVRDMVVCEKGQVLLLLAGAPPAWVRDGNGVRLENFPTHFGKLNLNAKASGNTLTVKINGAATPPGGIELAWPLAGKPGRVVVDGYKWTDFDENVCRLPATAKEVIAEWAAVQ